MLTDRQKKDLHAAVLEYLTANGFETAAAAFAEQDSLGAVASTGGALERKWVMVGKQAKKIMDLEKKVKEKDAEIASGGGGMPGGVASRKGAELLPASSPLHSKEGHRNPITCVAFHPSYGVIVSGSEDATIRVWDPESGEYEKAFKGHTNSVTGVCFNKTGQVLASCSADHTIKVWDFADNLCLKTLKGHEHSVSSVSFLPEPNNEKLVSASRDTTIKLWDTNSGFCVKTFSGHEQWVRVVTPNTQGTMLASCGDDHSIRLWDVESGRCLESQIMMGHEHIIETLAWLPAAAVKTVMASPEHEGHFPAAAAGAEAGADAASVRPLLLSGSRDKTIMLWDGATATCLKVYKGHDNWVRGVWLGNQGKSFFSCSDDKSIRVWDLASGRNTKTQQNAHAHFVQAIACSANARVMATGGVDCKLNIWPCR